jgi:hypothetical protein
MQRMMRLLVVSSSLLAAAPALAQLYPEPPPPPEGVPPPGQPPPPAQPAYSGTKVKNNVLRASGGVAFASVGYWCGYYYYYGYPYYSCYSGYSTTMPDVNLDFDLGLSPTSALGLGVNVMWGSYHSINTTVWEPHVDYLFRAPPLAKARWRLRIGAGLYVSSSSGTNAGTGRSVNSSSVGGAFRLGFGVSVLNDSPVGIGLDSIFEAGSVRGYYASTIQLLAGPEFHF